MFEVLNYIHLLFLQ